MTHLKTILNMIIYFLMIFIPIVLVVSGVVYISTHTTYHIWMFWLAVILFIILSIVVLYDISKNDPIIK